MRYDVAIIGTGPAGISAALTLTIRKKKILLFGSKELSKKVAGGHKIQNYPGFGQVTGDELQKALQKHLQEMEIEIIEDRIGMIMTMGSYYMLQGSDPDVIYEASTVILAGGVAAVKTLPGEEEYLGEGVSYCATCDAGFCRGKDVTVIGYSPKEESEAEFLTQVAAKVTYIPMYKEEVEAKGLTVKRETPVSIKKEDTMILLTGEGEYHTDQIFVLRDAVAPNYLVPGLTMDGNHVAINRKTETNLKGLFAAGDITGTPYQYAKAVGEGNVAALQAVEYLASLK